MKKYVVSYYSPLEGLDLAKYESQDEFDVISFTMMLKHFNSTDISGCKTVPELLELVASAGAFIKILEII